MMNTTSQNGAMLLVLLGLTLLGCDVRHVGTGAHQDELRLAANKGAPQPISVSGSAIHYVSEAIIHSEDPIDSGMIQRSTDTVELTGDLSGYILYHPTSVFDYTAGTLTVTGTQIFSGTIAGSPPLILHDDAFRFEVDLNSGATIGEAHLERSKDAPHQGSWYECDLNIVGTGVSPEGDYLADYSGECMPRDNL